MGKVILDRLVDDILEIVLEDMDCCHEVSHEEDGDHISAEYNLKSELEVRNKIIALLGPSRADYSVYCPPGRDKSLDAKFVAVLRDAIRHGIGEVDFLEAIIREYEKPEELPEKKGLVVDAIISKYPVAIRILLVQLIKQIEKEKKEGG